MLRLSVLFLFILLIFPSVILTARILAVFPIPSISHQVVFRAYVKELAKRGHEVTVITPNPAYTKDKPFPNITEIDVSDSYKAVEATFSNAKKLNQLKRGVIADMIDYGILDIFLYLVKTVKEEFDHPSVKELIRDKNKKFDLIIGEAFVGYPLVFAHIFKAPIIQITSYFGTSVNYEAIGAVSLHPLLYPNIFRSKYSDSMFGKVRAIYHEWIIRENLRIISEYEEKLMKEQFGSDIPSMHELQEKVELLFVNSYPVIDRNRPVPPNVIYLGGIHMLPIKELPTDLKSYLDNSERGVIYVSLGTNIRPKAMDKDLLDAFIGAFEKLPYDILWKMDDDNLQNLPKNVKTQKWFPQRDLLQHPKIKLFVMQGGLQSTDEAIDAGVPLVGIPFLGDQWYIVKKQVKLGIGVQVDSETLTKDNLIEAALKVIGDKSYKENILKLRDIINDQPNTALERAVWWTEYVIRHGGAKHLRAPSANISWAEYLMLDVVIPVTVILLIVLTLAFLFILYVVKTIVSNIKGSSKTKTN